MQATKQPTNIGLAIFAGLLCISLGVSAQKKLLTAEEYAQWHNFSTGPVSADGIWHCYTMHHGGIGDTLYLKNSRTGSSFNFPSATNAKLTSDGKWLAMNRNDSLHVLNTVTGKTMKIAKSLRHGFKQNDRYLIAYSPQNTLCITDMQTLTDTQFENVREYSLVKDKLAMVMDSAGRRSVKLVWLGSYKSKTVASTSKQYHSITWNTTGTALAFYETEGDTVTGLHFSGDRSGYRVLTAKDVTPGAVLPVTKLYVSDDASRLFFDVAQKPGSTKTRASVAVWKSSATELTSGPPVDNYQKPNWYVWWPIPDKVVQIETDKLTHAVLTGDSRYALLRSQARYKPVYEFGARYQDIFLKDLSTGTMLPIIQKVSTDTGTVVVSPGGKYIAYYKEGHWWSYDIISETHCCLTKNSNSRWEGNDTERRGPDHVYGCGGWSKNDREILLYDQYDVWKFSLHGGKPQRLTKGFQNNVRYRIAKDAYHPMLRDGSLGFTAAVYDLDHGLLLKMGDPSSGRQGVAIWTIGRGTVDRLLKDRKIMSVSATKDKQAVTLLESAFDVSPRWVQIDKTGKEIEIAQANKQQKYYQWGKSELIKYEHNGRFLNAVLCYPAGFDPAKKYPMVVYIYEKMSARLHDYDFPSMQNPIGFNRTNLTLEGYFVLMPDLEYETNQVGNSALQCVEQAVHKVWETGYVDKDRIGLIGHSFGGFEAAYISSRTNLFKTAIVGAGVHDLRGHYLGIDVSGISNMERFFNGHFKNTFPFEHVDFEKESPINNVSTINIPLLIWTGHNDNNVPPWHSLQLHAALWRLKKKSTLLVYNGEEHTLRNKENRVDLTEKIMQWLGHYLKQEKALDWME